MSHPGYPNALPVHAVMDCLAEASASPFHEFWPADISLLDAKISLSTHIRGPPQITDLYLLALAVRNDGSFVTFDAPISMAAIKGTEKRHLHAL